ncbi:MAG: ABC transporter permease [Clostridia bacterium]|nr:ABC transporter permease [Clostridia bacterium]
MIDKIFTISFLTALLASGVRMAIPLMYAGLGEMVSEKSGVLNIGLEGVMLCGAFFSFAGAYFTGSLFLGLIIGMIAGMLVGLLHAFVCVYGKQNQTVSGLAINMIGLGITSYLYKLMCDRFSHMQIEVLPQLNIPLLSDIPVIGPAFFQQDILAYVVYILLIAAFVFYRFTRTGLGMAAIGEKPMAADAAGIHVERKQFLACAINGLLGGAGGAYMIVAQLGLFSDNMTAGRGYIALATVILGRYCPGGVFLASLLFGVANGAQIRLQALGVELPMQLLAMLPYVITLLALLITSGRSREPESLAVPYIRGGR